MQTHLGSRWDLSLSATSQRASALCLGTHQRMTAAPKFHISSLRSVRPPRSPGPWCLMNVRSALSVQPSSSRPMSTSSGSLLLTSLELADLWNPAPSLHRCSIVSGKLEKLFLFNISDREISFLYVFYFKSMHTMHSCIKILSLSYS